MKRARSKQEGTVGYMETFIKGLDKDLRYEKDEIVGDTYYLYVASKRKKAECPYCGQLSSRVHSVYIRSFQDLPIQDKKVIIVMQNRKMFCDNPACKKRTFAETFSFLRPKGKKSKRLIEKILEVSLNVSSVTAAALLSNGIASVGKCTICNMLKKTKSRIYGRKQ
jgi:transposase